MNRISTFLLALLASLSMAMAEVLTVSQAISQTMLLDSAATSEVEYNVEGYVVDAQSFNISYGNQIWYMVDDLNDTSAPRFYAYNCVAIENGDTLKVLNGDKVRLTGKLTKYYNKSIAEFQPESKNGVATFISKVEGDHSIPPIIQEISVAQALAIGNALADNASTEMLYTIRGYVSAINVKSSDTYNEQYGNQSFWVADEQGSVAQTNEDGAFYVYHGKPSTEQAIPYGAQVEFTCQIRKYVSASTNLLLIESASQNIAVKVLSDTIVERADVVFSSADFNGQGSTSPGGEVTAIKDGVTFTCDKAFGDQYGVRCYKNGVMTISSAEQPIGKIVFKFSTVSGKYYNGNLEDEIIVNGMSWAVTMTDQARMSKISIYFGEVETPPTISTDIFPENSGQVIFQNDTLFAIPNYGYHFAQWNDSVSENPRFIELTQDTSFTAIFAPNLYSFSATCDSLYGTIEGESGYLSYMTEINIAAIPNYGYHFTHWSDGITSNPRTITIVQDVDLIANFEPNSYSVLSAYNPNGTVVGTGTYLYQTECTLQAIPHYGYHFTQWLDGRTTNPRAFVVTQDTVFGALFDKDTVGLCGKDDALTWTYSSSTQTLTISGNGSFDENMECGVEAKQNMTRLIINEGVTIIGANAFSGCSNLTTLQLPTSLKSIGDRAFANCLDLVAIYNYRERPGLVSTNTFDGVNKFDCTLYVLAGSIAMYQSSGSNWRDFYFIEPIGSSEINEPITEVEVEPADNTATITWPSVEGAETYEIEITKDGEVVCTLIFNSNGQLSGIAFAPNRNNTQQAQTTGFRFTITGLTCNTQYGYAVTSKDSNDTIIDIQSGSFTTTGDVATDLDDVEASSRVQKVIVNDKIYILRGDHTYTLTGQEVK